MTDRKVSNGFFSRLCGKPLRIVLLIVTDFLWSAAVPLFCCTVIRYLMPSVTLPQVRDFACLALFVVIFSAAMKCYHGSILNPGAALNRVEEIRRLFFAVLGSYVLGFLFLLIEGRCGDCPPLFLLFSMFITMTGFPGVRFFIRFFMKKAKIGQIRVFIAGAGRTGQSVGLELASSVYYGYEVAGYFDDDPEHRIDGQERLGRVCDAPRLAEKYNTGSIICCLPPLVLPKILRSYTRSFKHVLVIPSDDVLPVTALYPTLIGFISGFEFQNRLLFPLPRIFKRLAEMIFAFFCIILLSPLFVLLALLVRLSGPGPIFYSAKRIGLGGREIKVFKFRTMCLNADDRLETLLEENPEMKEEWQKKFKLENDPRVTKIGHFLRRTSLDELPQFINVLRGEMAIVGPRPIVADEIRYYGETYDFFKRVRPGITGLWQVSGRSKTSYRQRVAMDMFYVMNWSFWLDWYILWKTLWVVLARQGSC